MNRNMTWSMYCAATVLVSQMPKMGSRKNGNSDVIAISVASVSHQIAIQSVMAAMRVTSGWAGSKLPNKSTKMAAKGPANSEIRVGKLYDEYR